MRIRKLATLVVATMLCLAVPVADAAAKGSSGGGGGGRSGGGGGGGGGKSSGGGGNAGNKSSTRTPSANNPSSGSRAAPPASKAVPRGIPNQTRPGQTIRPPRGVVVPRGRIPSRDASFLRSPAGRRHLDPYSRSYYGHRNSPYFYLWLWALSDGGCDEDDWEEEDDCPPPPQEREKEGGCNNASVGIPLLAFGVLLPPWMYSRRRRGEMIQRMRGETS